LLEQHFKVLVLPIRSWSCHKVLLTSLHITNVFSSLNSARLDCSVTLITIAKNVLDNSLGWKWSELLLLHRTSSYIAVGNYRQSTALLFLPQTSVNETLVCDLHINHE